MSWAAAELASADLGDVRRNRRLVRIMEDLAASPEKLSELSTQIPILNIVENFLNKSNERIGVPLERVVHFWDWLEWEYGKKSILSRCQ